ncbi:NAD(P)/FAD-dependent oxidoreductase [Acidovorax sp. NCPPB 4044]|uniref:NAD(P)/FAD-dependent oxidoreductase n=1 Tax=Acidovorax sp. NCPPB 4044 TaxID=2940490 RepID=UPI002302F8D9|nr:NAD(P)-binding protein [Acidovorax sp. NCPPB 4044]MDA8520628.1 NAD(P)-binding protein [Acidovorax sp. NCPPB 4044]
MADQTAPQKIAILGGGLAALTAAFELTSQPGWQDRFDITLYQMGWRLGGKCATKRGPNDRIEEHGIHGFLGSYYNALPLMAECYQALGRDKNAKLATFEQAFIPESFVLMWEYENSGLRRWPMTLPTNRLSPADASSLPSLRHWIAALIETAQALIDPRETPGLSEVHEMELRLGEAILERLKTEFRREGAEATFGTTHPVLEEVWDWLGHRLKALIDENDDLRRLYTLLEYMMALVRGVLADSIFEKGFDSIDGENFSDWLQRHGASVMTASSPLALNTVNLSYQYPAGDTARTASMGAGAYLHWSLRSYAYLGAFAWLFAAGTGETVIAPLYLVLRQRGVKFEFFHKVQNLALSADQQSIASVEMAVQATLKDPSRPYDPLVDIQGLPSWPSGPLYDQLVQGEALQAQDIDLESYWTPWQNVGARTLRVGEDFDQVVFAIAVGAVPYLCKDLLAARPAWRDMVEKIPTVQTQTMQIWLNRSTTDLGWDLPLKNPTDTVIGATYLNPLDGQVDFTHLLPWESWPAQQMPQSLWYFSGAMADYEPPPPLTDTGYPARAHARVKAQCIQYLQVCMGPLLPKATTNVVSPPGDPMGMDFSLLQDHDPAHAGQGVQRFDQQFWRANIDPSERYVTSPPGSTAARLKAWESGFSNLVLAGDWIYTGLNVGSAEGAAMGGRLAAHAVSGLPALSDIVGYPQEGAPPALT